MKEDQKKEILACVNEEITLKPIIIGTTFRFDKFVYSRNDICKLKMNLKHKDAWILSQDNKTWFLSYDEKIINRLIAEGRLHRFT